MKYALISFAGFVLFAFIPIFGPLQEVELAHCVLGAVIVLISIAIYKLDKVLELLSADKDKK